jgi:hypothetical protein
VVRGVNGSTPNSATATVEKIEFLGAYLAGVLPPERHRPVAHRGPVAQRHGRIPPKPGDTLRVAVPPDRMRVFQ